MLNFWIYHVLILLIIFIFILNYINIFLNNFI